LSTLDDRPFPKAALAAAGLLIYTTVLGVGAVQLHKHLYTVPKTVEILPGTPVQTRTLRFVDLGDGLNAFGGHVRVFDASTGEQLPQLRENDGFIRAVLNSLAYERGRVGKIGAPPVFKLVSWSSHKLTLEDPATGKHVDVGEFGPGNKAVFLRLLNLRVARS
jgi:putative photosynthetic complex assembly protein